MRQKTFESLKYSNYRKWFLGLFVSNIGYWLQATAQDWVVLRDFSNQSAMAVGITLAFQFSPQVLLVPVSGYVTDRVPNLKTLLIITQTLLGLCALTLGTCILFHIASLSLVYYLALITGITAAFDGPARQTFINDLVPSKHLANAVSLGSAIFNAARMVGPAAAGLLITIVNSGWAFIINGISFSVTIIVLLFIKVDPSISDREKIVHKETESSTQMPGLLDGFKYIFKRVDIFIIIISMFFVSTFAFNFPIFISKMSLSVFNIGSAGYGFLSTVLACGSVAAALIMARVSNPKIHIMLLCGAAYSVVGLILSLASNEFYFACLLPLVGFVGQTFTQSANGYVQLYTKPAMRGRVLSVYLAAFWGGSPIGGPIIGLITDTLGPRVAIVIGTASGVI
ncbi:MAG: MFS transporter, partial [Bifidobacteriaceae bacterium]|nr:MFS transporter [Bifidobacteriaceae bacterium]